ncbi:MAG TPA: proprotein convertase P-domain-containing protein [Thermoanaerobaculia bacterium]|nr:proprotein convertase P-domain-containing protein [Thermoanaerobaculia bacterium]
MPFVRQLRPFFFIAVLLSLASSVAFAAQEPLKLAPSAALQVRALEAIKNKKTPTQEKIDSRLYLATLHARGDASVTPLTDFRFIQPERDGRVAVDIVLTSPGSMKAVLQKLESLGEVVRGKSARYQRVSARVSLANLEALAALPEVKVVRQRMPFFTSKVNTSEGDLTHQTPVARGMFGVTGSGVKIGVISDGVDSLASLQVSGDLPATVEVLPGQAGSGDEGSAMLEIVHDLAPDAELAFATAITDEAQFAQNILDLAAAGCDVIVDDIIYLDESPFQDGPVAQAVNTVTAAGVLYFSSAGNEGNANDLTSGTWEGDFVGNGTPAVLAGAGPVHNFGDGGQSILVEFGAGTNTPPILIWAEHYDLATGSASTDYDLYVLNSSMTTIFDASTDTQDGTGGDDWPIEFIGGGTFSNERIAVAKFADGATSSDPMFNLIVFRGELDDALATNGATRGHSATQSAFSVAATPAASSFDGVTPDGPFPGIFTTANESESFTSDGPRRLILDPAGAELTPGNRTSTGGVVRQKPDISAADGVQTASPGFNPFYGTSAAAPHAAAIAGLMLQAVPAATPAQVRTALLASAIDIETAGTDRDTGAGIIMATAALQEIGATPQAFLDAGALVPAQLIGDGDAYVETNEVFSLLIPITNIGGVGATAVSAVLSTVTPGVTINTANSAYPDLPPTVSGNNVVPFVFTVGPSAACGGTIEFSLVVTYSGGATSPRTFELPQRIGSPGTPMTFSYTGPVVAIPDGGDPEGTAPGAVANADLAVAGVPGNVWDVDVQIDGTSCSASAGSTTVGIDHTFVNDLQLTLRAPNGDTVLVVNNTDGGGNNLCQTLLDDESAGASIQSVGSAQAPFTGSFTPNQLLTAFDGDPANGTWQLQAQDFFSADTGNIRAYSLIITPAVCDAPPLTPSLTATKTVSGIGSIGSTVTYTVVITNNGGLAQGDNSGNEFADVLPASLTLVSANATSGSAVATIGTNTVSWNGTIPPLGGSVTITIVATVNNVALATTVSNQGTVTWDADGSGNNKAMLLTDDPSVVGAANPTAFTVVGNLVTATKSVTGTFTPGGTVTYSVTLSNAGNAIVPNNTGDEFTDVLPSSLTLVSAGASSGTAAANLGTNTVTWSGTIAAAGSVTITITATVKNATTGGTVVSNQGNVSYDADLGGTNDTSGMTDDSSVAGAADPTNFTVTAANVTATKTASGAYSVGSNVTYTITLSNSGNATAPDSSGSEFTDVLPSSLTLVSANATSGTASATIATNTVTWNGAIPAAGSVTVTIVATIEPGTTGTTITNQAAFAFDANSDGTNESNGMTDDPGVGGAADGTAFVVAAAAAVNSVTKSVAGNHLVGSNVSYTIVISNSGDSASADNAGNELTDVLPSSLTLLSATASSGTATANVGTNTVTWNGSVPAAGSVTITITAKIENVASGTVISNQATHSYDSDGNGTNDATVLSDDPSTVASGDPTAFAAVTNIPTASEYGLMLLAAMLAIVAIKVMRG